MRKKRLSRLSRILNPGLLIHAVKTALAALAALAAVNIFNLEQGYWAVITAIIVMQANLGGSLRAGWSRLLGTAVGAVVSAGLVWFMGGGPLALTLGVFLTILICSATPLLKESSRIAGITAAIVILVKHGDNPFHVGAVRFSEIALGIVVALAVSLLILPRRSKTAFRHGLRKMLEEEAAFYAEVYKARLTGVFRGKEIFHLKDKLARLLIRNQDLLREARAESFDERNIALLTSILRTLDRVFENILTMEHVVENVPAAGIHEHMGAEMEALKEATIERMRGVAEYLGGCGPLPDFAPLDEAIGVVRARLAALRKNRTSSRYDLAEVMHFFSFIHAMMACAVEVRAAAARAGELRGQK